MLEDRNIDKQYKYGQKDQKIEKHWKYKYGQQKKIFSIIENKNIFNQLPINLQNI